ncbi:hypothetical protein [Lacinutrix chionoecetis]
MLKFITENFHLITYAFEILALITGIIFYKKYKNTTTKLFIYYLFYVVFVEQMGMTFTNFHNFPLTRLLKNQGFHSTAWFNLFWMFGSILFVAGYVHSVLKKRQSKTAIKILSGIFVVVMISHFILFPQIFLKQHHQLYSISGALLILSCCSIYFIEYIKADDITKATTTFSFYALSALLIWWIVIAPILFFDAYNTEADWDFANLKRRIFVFANMFMYSLFTIGFIVSKPKKRQAKIT